MKKNNKQLTLLKPCLSLTDSIANIYTKIHDSYFNCPKTPKNFFILSNKRKLNYVFLNYCKPKSNSTFSIYTPESTVKLLQALFFVVLLIDPMNQNTLKANTLVLQNYVYGD